MTPEVFLARLHADGWLILMSREARMIVFGRDFRRLTGLVAVTHPFDIADVWRPSGSN